MHKLLSTLRADINIISNYPDYEEIDFESYLGIDIVDSVFKESIQIAPLGANVADIVNLAALSAFKS